MAPRRSRRVSTHPRSSSFSCSGRPDGQAQTNLRSFNRLRRLCGSYKLREIEDDGQEDGAEDVLFTFDKAW